MANNEITLHEVYKLVNDRFDRLEDRMEKMDARILALEIWRAEIVGKLAIVAAGIAAVFSLTTDWLKRRLFS